ncbi:Uu.00g056930.m01.CDS01 [Anthostomella pinea]|uniref:Uu.00g056930.m01.CDS01 n=1 Tax=Anthostomella pinea TaxID=933095 RepID=A0AAI8VSG8_9PEZI|nr:Uu.00g056930.m01.CDS01 [Anthostomella pinea]
MTTVLGKRKSRTQKAEPPISHEEAHEVFRRLFESQFQPLPDITQSTQPASAPEPEDLASDEDDSDGSWGGLSETEGETGSTTLNTTVEVVSHTKTPTTLPSGLSKREAKAWLSSRPPTATDAKVATTGPKNKKGKTTADEDAPSLIKNDLALQRLLSESHLFSSSSATNGGGGGGSTEHTGRNRHLATDLRLTALGAKGSIFKQDKMPMHMRKGIVSAAAGRESRRRQEAKENGIVLERPVGAAAAVGHAALGRKATKARGRERRGPGSGSRDRPVGAPSVGRLNNGTLKLSKRDIHEIESSGPRTGRGGGKRRM